jgi:hypothetical protein
MTHVVKHRFGCLFFLVIGGLCLYACADSTLDVKILGLGVGAMALSLLLLKWCVDATRRLWSIHKTAESPW